MYLPLLLLSLESHLQKSLAIVVSVIPPDSLFSTHLEIAFPSFLTIITQRFLPAHGGICRPPPQHLIPAPAPLLLLVSVTTTRQESSSGGQVCSFPLQLGPSLVHTSQLSGYPAVRERGSSERCRSLWATTPESRRGWRCGV